MARIVKTEDAVGEVLLHDITAVDPDKGFKGRIFKKGHIIREEDVRRLKEVGKDHIYVFEIADDEIHEDDAAKMLAKAVAGENTRSSQSPKEGKIDIYADAFGLCKIDTKRLMSFNSVGEPSCPTIYNNSVVKEGDNIAAVRIISLTAPLEEVQKACEIAGDGIVKVIPFVPKKAGLIITGNEVYHGRIKDKFHDKLKPKLEELLCEIAEKRILPDDRDAIRESIEEFADRYDIVILTGGTSVDPDDVTYKAIKDAGVRKFIRGNPIQPGNMLTMGWIGETPIAAVPAAAIFFKWTSFDIWLPRFLAGDTIERDEVIARAHGGLLQKIKEIR
jgi:molybdenum cofactor synthesis domain-containing protein